MLVKGISEVAVRGRKVGIDNQEVNTFVVESLFATITNANFDDEIFVSRIKVGNSIKRILKRTNKI